MTRIAFLVAISLFLFASSMEAEDLTDVSAGTKVSNSVTMGETQIPLPKGEWELRLVHTKRHQNFGELGRAFLVQETGESGFDAVDVISNIDSCASYKGPKGICGRKNTHHNESTVGTNSRYTRCWNVNHFSINPNKKSTKGYWKKFSNERNELLKKMIGKRTTFMVNQFYWADRCHFATITYAANPSKFGFPSESNSWKDSVWHRDVVGEEPRHNSFVAATTDVGKELKEAVEHGFKGNLDDWTSNIIFKFE